MQTMRVEIVKVNQQPDLKPLARHLLDKIRKMVNEDGEYKDPEMEAKFQEWKRQRDAAAEAEQ